jgi:hypothetical protein
MQICQDHWHEIKNAIRQRGLWKFVTPAGYASGQSIRPELNPNPIPSTFDPLMAESLMISEQARMAFGSYAAVRSDCPLCEAEQNLGAGTALEWIDTDADTILALCREQNMVRGE